MPAANRQLVTRTMANAPPILANALIPRRRPQGRRRRPRTYAASRCKMPDWFPVTAELGSATRERLRGVLVDARLGVTGRVRRPRAERAPPQREFILPVTVEKGLD